MILNDLNNAPPLDGEGLGWGRAAGRTPHVPTFTPTQPSPIEEEGFR
jgi:hypothetical protein